MSIKFIDDKDRPEVEFAYPKRRPDGMSMDEVVVSLMHVRAAQDIHIRYDFERDGWAVTMAVTDGEYGAMTEDGDGFLMQEVAFIGAWAAHREEERR